MRATIFSPCREYRYSLWREWDMSDSRYAMFVGLNPSTADEVNDDPTIRRCIGFAKAWGFGALCMANAFAYRATDPKVMKAAAFPIGGDNDRWLKSCAAEAGVIIAAWGVHGDHMGRDSQLKLLLPRLQHLGLTKHGHPKHPLYLRGNTTPQAWRNE